MNEHDREHKKLRTERESKARTNCLLFGVLFGGIYGYALKSAGVFDRRPAPLPIDHFARGQADEVAIGLRALMEELGVDPEKVQERHRVIWEKRFAPQQAFTRITTEEDNAA